MANITINQDKTISIDGIKTFPLIMRDLCDPGVNLTDNCIIYQNSSPWNIILFGYTLNQEKVNANTNLFIGRSPTQFISNNNNIGFYQLDEPTDEYHQSLILAYNNYKILNPNKIVISGHWKDALLWTDISDIMLFGLYPYSQRMIDQSGDRKYCLYIYEHVVKFTLGVSDFDTFPRPLYPAIQATENGDSSTLKLTKSEIRALIYTSLTFNAKGLYFFSGINTENGLINYPSLLKLYEDQMKELLLLENILLLPSEDYSWQYNKGTLVTFNKTLSETVFFHTYTNFNWILKQSENTYYLIIVNKDTRPISDVEIIITPLLNSGLKIAKTIGTIEAGSTPNRILSINNGKFTDTFYGLAVHIYQIGSSCPPSECNFTITQ